MPHVSTLHAPRRGPWESLALAASARGGGQPGDTCRARAPPLRGRGGSFALRRRAERDGPSGVGRLASTSAAGHVVCSVSSLSSGHWALAKDPRKRPPFSYGETRGYEKRDRGVRAWLVRPRRPVYVLHYAIATQLGAAASSTSFFLLEIFSLLPTSMPLIYSRSLADNGKAIKFRHTCTLGCHGGLLIR